MRRLLRGREDRNAGLDLRTSQMLSKQVHYTTEPSTLLFVRKEEDANLPLSARDTQVTQTVGQQNS